MEHLKLVICYHCQALADHLKPACPYLNEAQFCAKCSQQGHSARDCRNNPYCLHCGGAHPANARICPIYRQKFLEIFEEAKNQENHKSSQQYNNEIPPASPLNVPDAWVTLSDAVTTALVCTDSPRDFLVSMFSILKSKPPPQKPNSTPYKYNIDEWSQSSLESPSIGRTLSALSLDAPLPQSFDQEKLVTLVPDKPYEDYNFTTSPTNISSHDLEITSQCPSTPDSSPESLLPSKEEISTDFSAKQDVVPNSTATNPHRTSSKELTDQTETDTTKKQMIFKEKHLTHYSDGLRIVNDMEKRNPEAFYLSIPKPKGAQVWYSDSQLYPHKKAMVKRKKKLGFIAPPKRSDTIEVLRIR